jgi:hypothetical protein
MMIMMYGNVQVQYKVCLLSRDLLVNVKCKVTS